MSKSSWQPSITVQYASPVAIADTSFAPHGDHGLVQQGDTAFDLTEVDQAPAFTDAGERGQLGVPEALADADGFAEASVRRGQVAGVGRPQRRRIAQVALLDTVEPAIVEEALTRGRPIRLLDARSPAFSRANASQNAQRAARATSPIAAQRWCARVQASELS